MTGYAIWCGCFGLFLLLGIWCFFSGKPVQFYANCDSFPVNDVKGYNRACGWLWIGYSLLGMVLGLPMLQGQNTPLILLSVIGVFFETLGLILIYVLVIEKKYRKK